MNFMRMSSPEIDSLEKPKISGKKCISAKGGAFAYCEVEFVNLSKFGAQKEEKLEQAHLHTLAQAEHNRLALSISSK